MKKILVISVLVLFTLADVYAGKNKSSLATLKPCVLTGENFISKSVFLESKRLGRVRDIVRGDLDPAPGTEIGITWDGCRQNSGAIFCNNNGQIMETVIFSNKASGYKIVDVEQDGICEFLSGGAWSHKVALLNHKGAPRWVFNSKNGLDGIAAADIDNDGELEFALSFNGRGGVCLLESNGGLIWKKKDSNAWHVEMADTNRDGNLEIISSNSGGSIKVRDKEGDIVSDENPEIYLYKFTISRWPSPENREYIIASHDDEKVYILDFNGKTIAEYDAPKLQTLTNICAVPVRLIKDHPHYFAVLIMLRASWHRSVLYVYDDKGNLAYQEIIPDMCRAMCVVGADKTGRQKILIGGTGKVWQYSSEGGE